MDMLMDSDFDLNSIVDYLFDAKDDAEFVQRFVDLGHKHYSVEQFVLVHKASRNGVSVYKRVCDALMTGIKIR